MDHSWTSTLCLVSLLVLTPACGAYGWADRTKENERPVLDVETVQSPPHLGMNDALLTRFLVDELNTRGNPSRWAANSPATDRLFCDVSVWDDRVFGTQYSVKAEANCRTSAWEVSRIAISQATLSRDASDPELTPLREQAAMDALRKAASRIALGDAQ